MQNKIPINNLFHIPIYRNSSFIGLQSLLKTVDIRSPKTVISVHFSSSKPMAMQIY